MFHFKYNLLLSPLFLYRKSLKYFSSTCQSHKGLLRNIRVLDLTRIVSGPICTMIFGDFGADVIKVEIPGSGDEARNWGPPFIKNTKESTYFLSLNRNKRSICVNLKSSQGKEIIYNLVKESDIFVENFIPGKLQQMGLGFAEINKINPKLIYCSLSGFGPYGPYAQKPGYDVIAFSYGGLMHCTGPEEGEPCKVGVPIIDITTGLYAHGAILAALYEREITGKGQLIECNLLSTTVASLIFQGFNYLNLGIEAKRMGSAHVSLVPYQTFRTSDNHYITIGTGSNVQFKDFCEKLEISYLLEDDRFKTNELRVKNREILIDIITKKMETKTLDEWMKLLEGASFACGPVNPVAKVFQDPQVNALGLVHELDHASAGRIKMVGPPVDFSESKNTIRYPPPLLGQHTREVLKEILNYSDQTIDQLIEAQNMPTLRLRLKKRRADKKVQWREGTVDNEHMNKKKSKCCCQYEKPRAFGESSSESEDECENCHGHVERKKKGKHPDDASVAQQTGN